MIEQRGGEAVKQHAEEAGIADDIKRIVAAFGGSSAIKDVAIFTPGKLTYVNEKPRRYVRIKPGGDGNQTTTKAVIKAAKENRPSWKK